jgi:hypothetical protein
MQAGCGRTSDFRDQWQQGARVSLSLYGHHPRAMPPIARSRDWALPTGSRDAHSHLAIRAWPYAPGHTDGGAGPVRRPRRTLPSNGQNTNTEEQGDNGSTTIIQATTAFLHRIRQATPSRLYRSSSKAPNSTCNRKQGPEVVNRADGKHSVFTPPHSASVRPSPGLTTRHDGRLAAGTEHPKRAS